MLYRHTLVCIDFKSVEANHLLRRAVSLLEDGGRLAAITVIEAGSFEDDREGMAPLIEEEHGARSAHLARLCSEAGVEYAEQRVLVGRPPQEIAAYAAEAGCDLVVLGEHEDDGRPAGLGFTADAVLRLLRCDSLVVKTGGPVAMPRGV